MTTDQIEFIGVGPRVGAAVIDLGLFTLLVFSCREFIMLSQADNSLFLFFFYLSIPFLFLAYNVIFHAACGQTLGKMVMKIKLYTLQFRNIDFKHAILRDSVLISLQLISVFGILLALQDFPSQYVSPEILTWPAAYVSKIFSAAQKLNPFNYALKIIYFAFGLLVFFSIIANRYKRSVNDRIAGTVLVRINF